MNDKTKAIFVLLFYLLVLVDSGCSGTSPNSQAVTQNTVEHVKTEANNLSKIDVVKTEKIVYGYKKGDIFLNKYKSVPSVKQIILVAQSDTEVSHARLYLVTKNDAGEWIETLSCQAFLGKNGIDKTREGDIRTPTGDFGMTMAFGAKDDPGSLIPYTKLTNTMYFCGDKEYYNQFIDISKVKHTCSSNSEHLLSYIPQYNYALVFDYNKENVYGKGSAIFLHCLGNHPFTMGCVAVAEENMIKILNTVDFNSRICIYSNRPSTAINTNNT